MKTEGTTAKRRKRMFPLAVMGLFVGLGAAYVMVRWQRRHMPWTALDREADKLSIYEVSGDRTEEWPVGEKAAAPTHLVDLDSTFDGLTTADTGLEY